MGYSKKRKEVGGFNGWEKIKDLLSKGSEKIRVGIKPDGKVIARKYKNFSLDNNEIGFVTSGTFGECKRASCNGIRKIKFFWNN